MKCEKQSKPLSLKDAQTKINEIFFRLGRMQGLVEANEKDLKCVAEFATAIKEAVDSKGKENES